MDNIRNVIKILFKDSSSAEVLKGHIEYDNIQKENFIKMARVYMPHYSTNELENMLSFLSSEFEWHNNKMHGRATSRKLRQVNVFDAVILFCDNVLVEESGIPLCRYEHLLRWREMIVVLDEDLFVTAFLAQKDILCGMYRDNFFWPPVIGHNNKELNCLMAQGVAENHFHLNGSSPTFHLSWISMMNDITNPRFFKVFQEYEEQSLNPKIISRGLYAEESLYISYLQAALIRLYLFSVLQDDFFTLKGSYIAYEQIEPYICWDGMAEEERQKLKKASESRFVELDDFVTALPFEIYKKYKKRILWKNVKRLLEDGDELTFYLSDIQRNIQNMKDKYADGQLDYMICRPSFTKNPDRRLNEIICGERWFLYEIFRRIYREDKKFHGYLNLFYAYLLIKENIRAELIQGNGNVGFHNFLDFQQRKEAFIEKTPFEEAYLKMAVRDTILNQHIKKLEARITPKDTLEKLKGSIDTKDRSILKDESGKKRKKLKKRFFYVCHFIKEADDEIENDKLLETRYRHFKKRDEVRRQAYAIAELRTKDKKTAERIRGIDAAAEEIVCRPEVFAQAFRFLKNHSAVIEDPLTGKTEKMPDLAITYHVGEDFLDVTDGLRAIDEAISFLNMRCGDRLGHALALGVNVEEWYASKSGRILISQMDYLDNLVWLYAKIRKYRIEGCEDTIRHIEKRYDEYFRVIYLNNMSQAYLEGIIQQATRYYEEQKIQNNYGNGQCYFTINTYYDSWKLRGDDPQYFCKGYFRLDQDMDQDWNKYAVNKIFPENYRTRYNPEAAYLYHTYHYNAKVKMEGNKKKEIRVNPSIIKAVKQVQKRMQWEIAQRGICIETNPSSNALIGTFKRYDKHPILNWYNKGLATSTAEVQSVPQIQVSINTDDQGVFATYIENEYAYLALALEKMKDENGKPKFSRTLIYQWLDNVRKMGLVQSFEEAE